MHCGIAVLAGNTVTQLGHIVFPPGSFGSHEIGGYLFIHQTYQCLQQLTLPEPPYLFAVLLKKWEMPWARAFPLRLMLRLGAEFRCTSCLKILFIFRSTPKNQPNNMGQMSICPSIRPYVRPQKVFPIPMKFGM